MNLHISTGTIFDRVARACGAISVGIGILDLIGWAVGSRVLTGVRIDYIPMAPNTALLVILLGAVLFSMTAWPGNRALRFAIAGIASLSLLIAGLTLLGIVTGINLRIDYLLLTATGTIGTTPIGLMSPVTAVCFLSGSAAVLLLLLKKNGPSALASLVMALIGSIVIIGYWFGAPLLYGGTIIPVALPTAAALGILGVGLIAAAGPASWPLSTVTGPSTRARLLRGLLPVILIIVLLVNWMNTVIVGHADSSAVLASAVTVIISLLVVYLVVTYVSREIGDAIDLAEQERTRANDLLKESEQKYRAYIDNAPEGVFIVDAAGTYRDVNPSACTMLGYSREELLSITIRELTPASALESALEDFLKLKETGMITTELQLVKKNGGTVPVIMNAVRLSEDRYLAFCTDITGRRRAEENLKFSNLLLSTEQEVSIDGILVVDESGKIISFNKRFAGMWGIPPDIIASLSDERALQSVIDNLVNPGEFLNRIKYLYEHKDEKSRDEIALVDGRTFDRYSSPMIGSEGMYYGRVWFFRDITDRKQMEESLRQEKDLWRKTFDSIPDLLALIDTEHRILQVNKAMADKLAVNPEAARGIFCYQAVHGTTSPPDYCPHHQLLQDGRTHTTDVFLPLLNGHFSITASPLFNPDGSLFGSVHLAHDITERKNAEALLKRFNEELEEKVRVRTDQLQKMNLDLEREVGEHARAEEQIRASLDEKVVLLREIHHRVKNNLQIIISLLRLQSRHIGDEKIQLAIRESQNRVRAMAHVHEKLYESPDITKIDLDSYIRFLGNSLFQFYGMTGKGIVFTTRIPEIRTGPDTAIPVGLIVNELISNSLKHAFPGGMKGEITIVIQRPDAMLTIWYTDDGVGIPADFDWRNADSLGLRLVILLVDQLDGTIELDRSSGTKFTIVVKETD